jgi:hypothetical protein
MTKKSKKYKSAVRAAITGVHGYVPPDVLTNAELSRMVRVREEGYVAAVVRHRRNGHHHAGARRNPRHDGQCIHGLR